MDRIKKLKSFQSCPFRIMLPSVSVTNGNVHISFDVHRQLRNKISFAVISVSLKLTSAQTKTVDQKVYFTEGTSRKSVFVDVPSTLSSRFVLNSLFEIHLIDENLISYRVSYLIGKTNQVSFQHVETGSSSVNEEDLFLKLKNTSSKQSSSSEIKDKAEITPKAVSMKEMDLDLPEYSSFATPNLGIYAKAIYRERCYLKKEGGRKYKITNGVLISFPPASEGYVYCFDMEAELYITDDAPLRLFLGTGSYEGRALFSEEFMLILQLSVDMGKDIPAAFFQVEPWKLLDVQYRKLQELNEQDHPIAMKLLKEGALCSTDTPATSANIEMGQEAAEKHARQDDITVVWGPPGTGKTYTMARIAISALKRGQSVLIVSHSNISVDGAIKKVAELLRNSNNTAELKAGKVLRYGYVRDDELAKDNEAVAYNYVLQSMPDLKNRSESLGQEKESLKGAARTVANDKRRYQIENELKKIRFELDSRIRLLSSSAKVLATTVSKLTIDDLFQDKRFDVVMFDEISMAYVTQILCAAMFADRHLICVGDFRQLSPIVQSEAKAVLSKDLFSFLNIVRSGKVYAHPWLVMLNEQRRMHPEISRYPNLYYYGKLLTLTSCVF